MYVLFSVSLRCFDHALACTVRIFYFHCSCYMRIVNQLDMFHFAKQQTVDVFFDDEVADERQVVIA
jgi:hypothetical protein